MVDIRFTRNIQRHVQCGEGSVEAATVRQALDAYFADNPAAKSYVVDDQGALRHHMALFVDGRPVRDRRTLSDPLEPTSEIYVLQALSGG